MPTHILKGALGLVLAALIVVGCTLAWNSNNPVEPLDQPLAGRVAAFSDTAAEKTTFWLGFQLGAPGDLNDTGTLRFSYRLEEAPEEETTVSFVLSGDYAEKLTTCDQQSLQIDRGLSFDELPMSGRVALRELEQSEQQGSAPKSSALLDDDEVPSVAAVDQRYTTITIPVTPAQGGLEADTEIVGAERNHTCEADLTDMWNPVSGGFRVLTPAMAAAAPNITSTSRARIYPMTQVKTDDRFFLQRSSHNFDQSGTSTSTTVDTNASSTSEGFDTAIAYSGSATYSSTSMQDRERSQTLLIGVFLGLAASIFIGVLSGGFDLVAQWFNAKRRGKVTKG